MPRIARRSHRSRFGRSRKFRRHQRRISRGVRSIHAQYVRGKFRCIACTVASGTSGSTAPGGAGTAAQTLAAFTGTTPGSTNAIVWAIYPRLSDLTTANYGDPNFQTWYNLYDEFRINGIKVILRPPQTWGVASIPIASPPASASSYPDLAFLPVRFPAVSWTDQDGTPTWNTSPTNGDITEQCLNKYQSRRHSMLKPIVLRIRPKHMLAQGTGPTGTTASTFDSGKSYWYASAGTSISLTFCGMKLLAVPYMGPNGNFGGFQPMMQWSISVHWDVSFRMLLAA